MVTTDTDSYVPLVINGTRDAAAIKEMIFTKVGPSLVSEENNVYLHSFTFSSSESPMKNNNISLYIARKSDPQQWERNSQTTY